MLVDFSYNGNYLAVSYINKNGYIDFEHFRYKPKKYIECDESDPDKVEGLKTWDNKPVAQIDVKYANRYSILYHLDETNEVKKIGDDTFLKRDLIFEHNMPKIFYMDIETEIVDGFPDQHSARTRVLANSWVYNDGEQDYGQMLGLKPLSDASINKIERSVNKYFEKFGADFKIKYKQCKDEDELLNITFKSISKMPVLTGWNFTEYDWVYLVNRYVNKYISKNLKYKKETKQELEKQALGELANLLGGRNLVAEWNSKTQSNTGVLMPEHMLIVDYMDLFAKYDTKIKIKETNKLDFVAEKILGLKKIAYEGSLQDLYENDFEKYMFYNIVDVILVKYLHETCKYMDIMFAISSMANIKVTDVFSSVRTTEGVLRRDFKENGIVFVKDRKLIQNGDNFGLHPDEMNEGGDKTLLSLGGEELNKTPIVFDNDNLFLMLDNSIDESTGDESMSVEGGEISIKGGWVKHPVKGMVPWTTVFDFASLYPTSMRQFNIASESYKGVTLDRKTCEFNGVISNVEPDDIVLLNGTVFRNEESVSKKKIETIFKNRKMYKNKMFEVRDKRIELEKQLASLM